MYGMHVNTLNSLKSSTSQTDIKLYSNGGHNYVV